MLVWGGGGGGGGGGLLDHLRDCIAPMKQFSQLKAIFKLLENFRLDKEKVYNYA